MPNTHETLGSLFTDIANSIRTKKGESAETKYVADNFPSAIDSIITDPSGDATATAGDILSPKTAYSQGSKITGTIPTKSASDLTASEATVSVPSGYYASNVSKSIDSGSATTPATTITTNPSVTWDSTNKKIKSDYSGSQSITPTVSAGYIASGTAGTVNTDGTTSVTAESLDNNLVASNVRDGAIIFNTTGTFSDSSTITGSGKSAVSASDILVDKSAFIDGAQIDGTMPNNGATGTTITSQGGTYTIPSGYTSGGTVTANITADTLDNSIISGQAVEEATGDYAWKSTVNVPAGYHNAQTLEKTFSEIFPAPETPATAGEMLLGYQAYNKSGILMTGTMANNEAVSATISSQGEAYTIPAGYHNGSGTVTASINNGVITSGAGSATVSDPSYDSGADNFTQTVTGTVAEPTVPTAGYVSLVAGTKNTNIVTGSKTLAKIVGSTNITGTAKVTPSINREAISISGVVDAASGNATTTAPSSGVYVKVKSAESANTVTATPSVTTSGYGTGSYHGITGNTVSAGANASADTYVPITVGTAGTPSASKGSVSGNSVTVTPSVTNTTGYISGGTVSGTGVTVSASELVSGTYTATAGTSASSGINITNYASLTVNPTPSESKTATANGTVTPSSGKLLSSVTVAIPVYDGTVN